MKTNHLKTGVEPTPETSSISAILLSTPKFLKWCLLLGFPAKILCASQSRLFDHPNDIWWKVQIIKVLVQS
jgi:hypothetical protein